MTTSERGIFDAVVRQFACSDERLSIWARYPHVTRDEDALTDGYACQQASEDFARATTAHGLRAVVIHAGDPEDANLDEHFWTRVWVDGVEVDVDWTARQYHNLEHPPSPRHANLPFPLVWTATGQHPVAGRFCRVTEVIPV